MRRIRMTADRAEAAHEALFWERILAKTGDSVVGDVLRGVASVEAWRHYPEGDAYDPVSGAQHFYHAHPPEPGSSEHGHFHCFVRPDGRDGLTHHLIAVGVDGHGRLLRLFTVNRWVTGDSWLPAEDLIPLLDRFDMAVARPSWPANRWLTAVLRLYRPEIETLIKARDRKLMSWRVRHPDRDAFEDRELEVLSELPVDLPTTARELLGGMETRDTGAPGLLMDKGHERARRP